MKAETDLESSRTTSPVNPDSANEAASHFRRMVESVGVKRFASEMGLSTRQINRILSGAQPNPIERMMSCLLCCNPEIGDAALDFICGEMGGHFVREEAIESASMNAVKECAEAIAAISDGEISKLDEVEIREAVQALISLARAVREARQKHGTGVRVPPLDGGEVTE